jgi:hypothetical protein
MSIRSRVSIESKGMFATAIFYLAVGIIFLALLPMTDFAPHLAIIGIFSLIVAYGVFEKRNWTIWLIIMLFLVASTFSAYMLYYYLSNDYLLSVGMLAYLILTWVSTAYIALKRESLES